MAELAGHLGSFHFVSDMSNSSDISGEAVGTGDGSTTNFALSKENVDYENLTVSVSDIAQILGPDFDITPKGNIIFSTAPTSDYAVTADYRYYKVLTSAGGFFNWNLEVTADALDVTQWPSTGWRKMIAGLKTWTGSAERHWIDAIGLGLLDGEQRVVVRFYTDETNSDMYLAWANITGFTTANNVGDVVDETLSFTGTLLVEESSP